MNSRAQRNTPEWKAYHREYNIQRMARIRAYLDGIKSASGCLICGEREPVCLDFHHMDPSKKEFNLSKLLRSQEKLANEVAKCVVLCSNCHRKLHKGLVQLPT